MSNRNNSNWLKPWLFHFFLLCVSSFSHPVDSWWDPTGLFSCCEMAAWPGRSKTSWCPRSAVWMSQWRAKCSQARLPRRIMLKTNRRTLSRKRKARARLSCTGTMLAVINRSCDWHRLLYIFYFGSVGGKPAKDCKNNLSESWVNYYICCPFFTSFLTDLFFLDLQPLWLMILSSL